MKTCPIKLARAKKWAKDNPERIVEIMRKHNYGITAEEYNKKKKKQKNRCAICKSRERRTHKRTGGRQSLSVDHNHETKQIRDLLCGDCNRGLGMFKDSFKLLIRASQYLKKHKRKVQW